MPPTATQPRPASPRDRKPRRPAAPAPATETAPGRNHPQPPPSPPKADEGPDSGPAGSSCGSPERPPLLPRQVAALLPPSVLEMLESLREPEQTPSTPIPPGPQPAAILLHGLQSAKRLARQHAHQSLDLALALGSLQSLVVNLSHAATASHLTVSITVSVTETVIETVADPDPDPDTSGSARPRSRIPFPPAGSPQERNGKTPPHRPPTRPQPKPRVRP